MTRYGTMERVGWRSRLRGLGKEAKLVYLALRTGPLGTSLPGLVEADALMLASVTELTASEVEAALVELERASLITVDRDSPIIRIEGQPSPQEPERSWKTVQGWWSCWQELPPSRLKNEHVARLRAVVDFDVPAKQGSPSMRAMWERTFGIAAATPAPTDDSASVRSGAESPIETGSDGPMDTHSDGAREPSFDSPIEGPSDSPIEGPPMPLRSAHRSPLNSPIDASNSNSDSVQRRETDAAGAAGLSFSHATSPQQAASAGGSRTRGDGAAAGRAGATAAATGARVASGSAAGARRTLELGRASRAVQHLVDQHVDDASRVLDSLNAARRRLNPRAAVIRASYDSLAGIARRLDAGKSVSECLHVVGVYEHDARRNEKTWDFFDAVSPWRPENFERALSRTLPTTPASPSGRAESAPGEDPLRQPDGRPWPAEIANAVAGKTVAEATRVISLIRRAEPQRFDERGCARW